MQAAFIGNKLRIVVATIAFAMGTRARLCILRTPSYPAVNDYGGHRAASAEGQCRGAAVK